MVVSGWSWRNFFDLYSSTIIEKIVVNKASTAVTRRCSSGWKIWSAKSAGARHCSPSIWRRQRKKIFFEISQCGLTVKPMELSGWGNWSSVQFLLDFLVFFKVAYVGPIRFFFLKNRSNEFGARFFTLSVSIDRVSEFNNSAGKILFIYKNVFL